MNNKHQYYIDLLKANHNIIFNGAPGTGKTYLAKEIAEAMGAKYKMVQFHPSYDYTDFVEGLRPVKDAKGNIGFERKDGVFKEFCKKSLMPVAKKATTYHPSLNEPIQPANITSISFHTLYEQLKEKIKKRQVILYSDFRNSKKSMEVVVEYGDIKYKSGYFRRATPDHLKKIFEYFRSKNIYDIRYTQPNEFTNIIGNTIDYSCYRGIVQELLNMAKSASYSVTEPSREIKQEEEIEPTSPTPFVFIIDEINRGEISKIFGELFFSIDPGYRGPKGLVQTQYQNLVEEGDVFKDGFYVPENVYIIGTMNDIDRNVESMDFAMRRRFAWQEITAEESAENMGITGELLERMQRLNQVIKDTEGLGTAYQVGAAMFKKVKDTEENVKGNCGMTAESLWNLNLKSLMKEYLRGLPHAEDTLEQMEKAYFLES